MLICVKAMVFITAWYEMRLGKDSGRQQWKTKVFHDLCE